MKIPYKFQAKSNGSYAAVRTSLEGIQTPHSV